MFPELPLSAAARAYRDKILSIPWTDEPIKGDTPDGIDQDEISFLHDLAIHNPKQAVPKILKCIGRFPDYPTLKNYLMLAYEGSGKTRQANETLNQLVKDHPDYLFARFQLALKALKAGDTDAAATALGPELDLRKHHPDRVLFHLSEMRAFYTIAGIIHARRGEMDLAYGAYAALGKIDSDPETPQRVFLEISRANVRKFGEQAARDARNRIEVRVAPRRKKPVHGTPPVFENEVIRNLYFAGSDLPPEEIREILALPRESLVRELSLVLDDCVARTPDFLNGAAPGENEFTVYHALFLLAEIDGTEALPSLLRVLSLHPHEYDFWLDEIREYVPQMSRIVGGGISECAEWLKTPGIASHQKICLSEAVEMLGRHDSARTDEAIAALTDTLAFLLESPREDNVLDTNFLGMLICSLIDLRATGAMPLIRAAYDRGLIEIGMVGTLKTVEEDIAQPMERVGKPPGIYAHYSAYRKNAEPMEPPTNLLRPDFGRPGASAFVDQAPSTWLAGRNDPCPCGSGKKYKKCCLK